MEGVIRNVCEKDEGREPVSKAETEKKGGDNRVPAGGIALYREMALRGKDEEVINHSPGSQRCTRAPLF